MVKQYAHEKCDICKGDIEHHVDEKTGKTYWTHGHNAEPVINGRCCDTCNDWVLDMRMTQLATRRERDLLSKFDTKVTLDSMAKYIIQSRRKAVKEELNNG